MTDADDFSRAVGRAQRLLAPYVETRGPVRSARVRKELWQRMRTLGMASGNKDRFWDLFLDTMTHVAPHSLDAKKDTP